MHQNIKNFNSVWHLDSTVTVVVLLLIQQQQQLFNGPLSRTTLVSQYQTGDRNRDMLQQPRCHTAEEPHVTAWCSSEAAHWR